MVVIKIFELFGEILLKDNNAEDKLDSIEKKAQGASKSFGSAVSSIAKVGVAVGGAVVAVGGLAVSLGDGLQKSLNGLQSATDLTDDKMIGMKKTMLDIYNNNFGENFEEIGSAMTSVSQGTGLAGDSLKNATQNALLLKDTFEMDVSGSVNAVSMMMKQFGVSGDEAYNLIAQGAQSGLNKNEDLLDTINEYSGTFKAQGFSATEMFNMLNNGAKSGAFTVDLLGDAMKEFGIRSKDGSTTSAQGFEALGLSAGEMTKAFGAGGDQAKIAFDKTTTALFAMKDPVAQNAAGVALFGTQWEDLGVKGVQALVGTKGSIDATKDSLEKINGVKYNTFGEAMTGIKRNLETGLLIPLSDKLLPKLNEFASWITAHMPQIQNEISYAMGIIGGVLGFVGDHMTAISIIAGTLGTAFVIFKTVTGIMNAVKVAQQLWSDATVIWSGITKAGTAIQWAMNAAMSANPIGIIILLIAALVAGIVLLFDHNKAFHDFIVNSWTVIKQVVGDAITAVVNFFKNLGENIAKVWESIKQGIETAWNGFKDFIVNTVTAIVNLVKDLWNSYINFLKTFWSSVLDVIVSAWNTVKTTITNLCTAIIDGVKDLWNGFKEFLTGLWEGIKNTASSAWDSLKTTVVNLCTSIIDGVKNIWNGLMTWFGELPSKLSILGSSMFTSLKNGISSVLGGLGTFIKDGFTSAISFITGLPAKMLGYGKDMIQGLINGITGMVGKVGDAVSGVANKIKSFLHFSVPDEGPLTEYEQWMPDFMGGLAKGIDANKYKVMDSIKGLTGNMSVGLKTSGQTDTAVPQVAEQGGGVTQNTVHVAQLIVREEADIQKISQELFRLQQNRSRSLGVAY